MAALRSLFFNRSGSSSLLGRTNFTDYLAHIIMRWKVSWSGNVVGAWDHRLSYVWQRNVDRHRFDTACIPRWIGVFRFSFAAAPNRLNFHDCQCTCAVFRPWSDAGHLEPLCVGFKYLVEICGCIRWHCQITLLVISCACFNFCWATCVPEHYAAIGIGVEMRHQYAPAREGAIPHAG